MQDTTVKKVEFLGPNQAIIILTDGKRVFNSYGVNIVEKDPCNNTVKLDERYWDYSRTTSKYRCQFLNELGTETKKKINSGDYVLTNLN